MNKRITKLVKLGIFEERDPDVFGYGTFLNTKKIGRRSQGSCDYMEQAKRLKKEADITLNTSRDDSIRIYIETIFLYIKGYTQEHDQRLTESLVHKWRSLEKYAFSIIKLTKKEECIFVLELIAFNVRFHYLYLEGGLMLKYGVSSDGNGIQHFLREYEVCTKCRLCVQLIESFML